MPVSPLVGWPAVVACVMRPKLATKHVHVDAESYFSVQMNSSKIAKLQ